MVVRRIRWISPQHIFRDQSGMIVLVPLISISVLLLALVLAGKLSTSERPLHQEQRIPEMHFAHTPVVVHASGRVIDRLTRGDSTWVVMLHGGHAVVFSGSGGASEPVGLADGLLLAWRPAP